LGLLELHKSIFSVFGRFIEEYLRSLTGWGNSKNRFELSIPKSSKNCIFSKNLLSGDNLLIFEVIALVKYIK
jgi:hypothetical protein